MATQEIDHWDYRLVKRELGGDETYSIFEVYYDTNNAVVGCMSSPVTIISDSPTEALWRVNLMLTAFEKPTLNYDDVTGGDEDN